MLRTSFLFKSYEQAICRSGSAALVEMGAQLPDGVEPRHSLGHLRLDRAVGVERIGFTVDDAGLDQRHLRRIAGAQRLWLRLVESRRGSGGTAQRRRRFGPPPLAVRLLGQPALLKWRRLDRFKGRRFAHGG